MGWRVQFCEPYFGEFWSILAIFLRRRKLRGAAARVRGAAGKMRGVVASCGALLAECAALRAELRGAAGKMRGFVASSGAFVSAACAAQWAKEASSCAGKKGLCPAL